MGSEGEIYMGGIGGEGRKDRRACSDERGNGDVRWSSSIDEHYAVYSNGKHVGSKSSGSFPTSRAPPFVDRPQIWSSRSKLIIIFFFFFFYSLHLNYFISWLFVQVPPVIGILTRQDLRPYNILSAFPDLARTKGNEKRNWTKNFFSNSFIIIFNTKVYTTISHIFHCLRLQFVSSSYHCFYYFFSSLPILGPSIKSILQINKMDSPFNFDYVWIYIIVVLNKIYHHFYLHFFFLFLSF